MKEKNMDHDFPPNLQTDNLYSDGYLKWRRDLERSVKAQSSPGRGFTGRGGPGGPNPLKRASDPQN